MLVTEHQNTCQYCGSEFHPDCDISTDRKGFWCDVCDGYTFFNPADDHRRFYLILENKSTSNTAPAKLNKVRLNKRLSPLRYPGAKSKIADYLLQKIKPEKTDVLISPFAGGASVELAFLHANIVKKLILNDYDFGIYSLFTVICEKPDYLIRKIDTVLPNHDDFFRAREVIKAGFPDRNIETAAWYTLLVNRLAYSGIYYANPLGGAKGSLKQLLSRWNPKDLIRRIKIIHSLADRITVLNEPFKEVIEECYFINNSTMLIDPPYYKQGKNLYRIFFTEDDHVELNVLLDLLHQGIPGSDLILCYDDNEYIENLYVFPKIERIERSFSV